MTNTWLGIGIVVLPLLAAVYSIGWIGEWKHTLHQKFSGSCLTAKYPIIADPKFLSRKRTFLQLYTWLPSLLAEVVLGFRPCYGATQPSLNFELLTVIMLTLGRLRSYNICCNENVLLKYNFALGYRHFFLWFFHVCHIEQNRWIAFSLAWHDHQQKIVGMTTEWFTYKTHFMLTRSPQVPVRGKA